ncbi:3-hydroxyisobutyryl-CoA hydrolase, mitochondrial-like [Littorina saxatilis]|uniref:3-hydroxyisobutyryl-CoA hydrolase, mitochondrial-like n=1 Tax=Littorina saxatilis TaxID=31220 RepID=UPI0038B455AA
MIPARSLQRFRVVLPHAKKRSFSTQPTDDVLFNAVGDKRVIILNRPQVLNALNMNMVRQIYPMLLEWETDPGVSMVMIKAVGEKAFCAGGDLRALVEACRVEYSFHKDFLKKMYTLDYKIGTYKKPYVALIDGITMGSGVGVSVHGNYRVATERTVFAMPEVCIGLYPDVGCGHFLPRLQGRLGMYLALTGLRLKGRDVFQAGVATHFVQAEKLPALEEALMELPDASSDLHIGKVLDSFHSQNPIDKDEPFILAPHMEQINDIFSQATLEDIVKCLESDQSEWAEKQLKTLKTMSPKSLKVTLRHQEMGKTMSLAQILQIEYRLSQRCMEDHDFYEGVRAVITDKDQQPQWLPSTLEEVTAETLDRYFSPLPPDRELVL